MNRFIIAITALTVLLILSCKQTPTTPPKQLATTQKAMEKHKRLHRIEITAIPHTGTWYIENLYDDGSRDGLRQVNCQGLAKALSKRLGCSMMITPGVEK